MYIAKDMDDFRKDNRMLLRVYKCNQWKTRIFFGSVQSYEKYPTGIVNVGMVKLFKKRQPIGCVREVEDLGQIDCLMARPNTKSCTNILCI